MELRIQRYATLVDDLRPEFGEPLLAEFDPLAFHVPEIGEPTEL